MTTAKKPILTTYNSVLIAILTAMATILYMPQLQIPVVAFYKLDFSNFVVLLGGFAMGPVQAMIILVLKASISLIWSGTMGIGELADVIIGTTLILPATILYHRNKTRKTAVPFNLLKGVVLCVVTGLIYKPLSPLLHGKMRR